MTNKERFSEAYRRHLKAAATARPTTYGHIIGHEDEIADKMLVAIEAGTANKDGYAFRETCKELHINHTYQAIKAYWNG